MATTTAPTASSEAKGILRIAWASPVNINSAIGRFTASTANALLALGHHVHVIATELDYGQHEPAYPCNATITHWSKMTEREMNDDYDIVVINIGDHYLYHAGLFWIMDVVDTFGIFHDFFIYNLFHGWLTYTYSGEASASMTEAHDKAIVETYGLEMLSLAHRARAGNLSLQDIAQNIPMAEWVSRRCGGALAHAQFYKDRLIKSCTGPVEVALLAGEGRGVALVPNRPRQSSETLIVLTVGIMNANKCADRVIEAIATSPLRSVLEYHLVGLISPAEEERLRHLAARLGFNGLRIFGQVDDDTLTAHLTRSDIIFCLRQPVLEGASGSAVEALLSGRPLIVADIGFYAELPDDVVFKVSADIPIVQLQSHLLHLALNGVERIAVGAKAKIWADAHLGFGPYLTRLEPLMYEVVESRPAVQMARKIGDKLSKLGLFANDTVIKDISLSLSNFSGGRR